MSKNIKDILIEQIENSTKDIQTRKNNGWNKKELGSYVSGVSNTLIDTIITIYNSGTISYEEFSDLDKIMSDTIDSFKF